MQEELKSHKIVFALVAMWLVIFLVILFLLDLHHYSERVEAEIILVLSIAVTSALGYIGIAEIVVALQLGRSHRRELIAYLVLGVLSLMGSVLLALTTQVSLSRIALVISPYAIFFGLFQLRLGSGLPRHPAQARSLKICGISEVASGVLMACGFLLSDANVITLLGVTATSTLLQLFPFLFFSTKNA